MRLRTVFPVLAVGLAAAVLIPWPTPGRDINPMIPDWVRPGLRLTYYLLTGSVAGSTNGVALDWKGNITDQYGRTWSPESDREGHASHGLIQATVAGMDSQVVALSEAFYLFNGADRTPLLLPSGHIDMMVTPDTGGDFWMHPQKQAMMLRQYPMGPPVPGRMMAQATTWRDGNQTWPATAIISQGDTGKTFWVYDQATGRLLYLSRVSRDAPNVRSPYSWGRDPVSYATIMRFVAARQLNLPWLGSPTPDWARQLQGLSYRGQQSVVFPGAAPGAGQALAQNLQVSRRGGDWLMFQATSQAQWQMSTGNGTTMITGTGLLEPLIIPPSGLARLRPGQEIDRDPQTGWVTRVAGANGQSVALQSDGPGRSILYVYDRGQGLMQRSTYRERGAGVNQFVVREMQLAGKR